MHSYSIGATYTINILHLNAKLLINECLDRASLGIDGRFQLRFS